MSCLLILPDLHHTVTVDFWTSPFIAGLSPYDAFYLISVRQYQLLLSASFRFSVAGDTLAVR
jgi:hypothetical protein